MAAGDLPPLAPVALDVDSTSAGIAENQGNSQRRPAGYGVGRWDSRFAETRVARLDAYR